MAFAGGGLCAFLGQMGAGNGGQARFCSPQTIGRAAQCVPTAGDTEPCCLRAAPLRWVGLHGTDDAPRGGGGAQHCARCQPPVRGEKREGTALVHP